MTIHEDLDSYVTQSFDTQWTLRDGQKVPEPGDIKLGNDAVKMEATILYADLTDSTGLVEDEKKSFASEVYESYVYCAAKIIRNRGGSVTAYDGDRVMGVFISDRKNTDSARCALELNYAVNEIIRPALKKQYPSSDYTVSHKVGIDTSDVWVVNTGIRGNNDHVWVGTAANYAAKMATLQMGCPTYITDRVYTRLLESSKLSKGVDMWDALGYQTLVGDVIYGSTYQWKLS